MITQVTGGILGTSEPLQFSNINDLSNIGTQGT